MNCESCTDLLIDYLHREVPDETRTQVNAHLSVCGDCARACCQLRAELEDIAMAHELRPSAGVRESLRQQVERTFAPPWYRRVGSVLARPVPAYGALALAALPFLYLASSLVFAPSSDAVTPVANDARVEHYDASAALGLTTVLF